MAVYYAIEWSGGSVINLGQRLLAYGINDAGQVVGVAATATEWSGGSVINLGALPGSVGNSAAGINSAGQVVGLQLLTRPRTLDLGDDAGGLRRLGLSRLSSSQSGRRCLAHDVSASSTRFQMRSELAALSFPRKRESRVVRP